MGGGAASSKPFSATTIFPFFPIIIVVTVTTLILITSAEDDDSKEEKYGIPDLKHNTSSPPMGSTSESSEALKPGTVMIMGVLTTTFSLTFLLLVYIKHCNNVGNTFVPSSTNIANAVNPPQGEARSHERKNSGIEREVVELLPAFRFGSLRGQKEGLDCAVCLNGFDDAEVLRLLPKCKHAFHVECVDTWLGAHSTCPLCRYKVDPEDVVVNNEHASVGERDSGLLQIILQQEEGNNSATTSSFWSLMERTGSGGSRKILRSEEGVGSGVGPRKDGGERRLEHRIIVSPLRMGGERWSDVEEASGGMLYLTSDMIIISDVGSSSSQGNARSGGNHINVVDGEEIIENGCGGGGGGRGVVSKYLRSVSEMTGMRRFLSGNSRERRRRERERGGRREQEQQQQEGVV